MQEKQINTAQITDNPSGKFRKMRDLSQIARKRPPDLQGKMLLIELENGLKRQHYSLSCKNGRKTA